MTKDSIPFGSVADTIRGQQLAVTMGVAVPGMGGKTAVANLAADNEDPNAEVPPTLAGRQFRVVDA